MRIPDQAGLGSGGGAQPRGLQFDDTIEDADMVVPACLLIPHQGLLSGELTLALFELAEDLAVTSVHIVGYPPYVDCPAAAEDTDLHDRGVRTDDVVPPVTAVTEDGQPADVDVDALRHIDIRVTADREDGHGGVRLVDGGFTQVKVEVAESAGGEGPPAQPEPPPADHAPEHGGGEAGRLTGGTGPLWEDLREIFLDRLQFPADAGAEGSLDPLGELLEGQPAREKVLAEHDHRVLAFGIRNPVGRVVHSYHRRPGQWGLAVWVRARPQLISRD